MADQSCTPSFSRRALLASAVAAPIATSAAAAAQRPRGNSWAELSGQLAWIHPDMPAALATAQRLGADPMSLLSVHLENLESAPDVPMLVFQRSHPGGIISASPLGAVCRRGASLEALEQARDEALLAADQASAEAESERQREAAWTLHEDILATPCVDRGGALVKLRALAHLDIGARCFGDFSAADAGSVGHLLQWLEQA